MLKRLWQQVLSRQVAQVSRKRQPVRAGVSRTRLRLEALEDRNLLSGSLLPRIDGS
jgi:hypothetical protein